MALILNIDTSVENASVCLAEKGVVIAFTNNSNQSDHASWIHTAIRKLLKESGRLITRLDSVAVSNGPGSYTGLRVGLSTAKGICYALNIPLITINTLEMMAYAAKDQAKELICPMIDARRMEVFMAVYNKNMVEIVPGRACIVDKDLNSELLSKNRVIFFGNGSDKFKLLVQSPNAEFPLVEANACHLADISSRYFEKRDFADLAYSEPFYLKEFYTPVKKPIK
jgi:tRNA threonylcarbamoyladenosine biosynthesis protein TsaB